MGRVGSMLSGKDGVLGKQALLFEGAKFKLCLHLLSICPHGSYLKSLSLGFLAGKMGTVAILPGFGCQRKHCLILVINFG